MKMRAWQIAVVGIMAIALISTSLILVRQTQPTISDEIFYIKASIEDSVEAIKAEDPNAAKIYVSEVWSSLNKAKGLIETENEFKNETKNFETALRMYEELKFNFRLPSDWLVFRPPNLTTCCLAHLF